MQELTTPKNMSNHLTLRSNEKITGGIQKNASYAERIICE
jgi:hypothetical protein